MSLQSSQMGSDFRYRTPLHFAVLVFAVEEALGHLTHSQPA